MDEQFKITDDLTAEWALSKIHEAEQERDKFTAFYSAQTQKITDDTTGKIEYFTRLLNDYFATVPKKTTKTGIEKYKLPSGELVWSPPKQSYERDNALLLAWLEKNKPEYIKVTSSPMWEEVKKAISETGELPDGVTPVEKPGEFKVKVN